MKPSIFVHTNDKQLIGALVSAHSFRRNAVDPDAFRIEILHVEDYPELQIQGRSFRRGSHVRTWDPGDLQSFTPLRFAIPDAMDHQGIALVVDPDVFAVADATSLLTRDRQNKAIWCCSRPGYQGNPDYLATSVMLLDCARLPHWRFADDLAALWRHELNYIDWIELRREDRSTIGLLEPEWNDFDRLSPDTKLLHNTKRRTQPWKSGLPVDFTLRERPLSRLLTPLMRLAASRYFTHPDPNQEAYFYALLAEALDQQSIQWSQVERAIALRHIRSDSPQLIDRYRGRLWPAELTAPRAA